MPYKNGKTQKEYYREYYQKNKDKINLKVKKYRKNNKETHSEYQREYKKSLKCRFADYRKSARVRKIQFTLLIEDLGNMVGKECYYCGEPFDIIRIDRLDSNGSYSKENIVPCCKICNSMKWYYSEQEFITQCQKVTQKYATRDEDR